MKGGDGKLKRKKNYKKLIINWIAFTSAILSALWLFNDFIFLLKNVTYGLTWFGVFIDLLAFLILLIFEVYAEEEWFNEKK